MEAKNISEKLLLNEVQLLLSEKRTYLSILRTGLAVFTVPLTVIAFLGATTEYHGLFSNLWLAAITIGGLLSISIAGLFTFYKAEGKISRINHMIKEIKEGNKRIAEILV